MWREFGQILMFKRMKLEKWIYWADFQKKKKIRIATIDVLLLLWPPFKTWASSFCRCARIFLSKMLFYCKRKHPNRHDVRLKTLQTKWIIVANLINVTLLNYQQKSETINSITERILRTRKKARLFFLSQFESTKTRKIEFYPVLVHRISSKIKSMRQ